MANRKTAVANFFETTLAATMGPTDLTAQVVSTAGLSSPAIVVIEPDVEERREVILFDGTFTATAFTTSALTNRYLDGSAAGSGITHEAGATVRCAPLAQHIDDLNDRIEAETLARINALSTHSGDEDAHHPRLHAAEHLADGGDPLPYIPHAHEHLWGGSDALFPTVLEGYHIGGGVIPWAPDPVVLASVVLTVPAHWQEWSAFVLGSFSATAPSNAPVGGALYRGGASLAASIDIHVSSPNAYAGQSSRVGSGTTFRLLTGQTATGVQNFTARAVRDAEEPSDTQGTARLYVQLRRTA